MARGYERRIGADTRDFERAVKDGVIKPVEDAARSLDEFADSGEDAGRGASRGLEKVEDSAGKLEKALRDAQKQSEKTERAVDDIGDGGSRGLKRASDATSEFKDEAKANFSEIASSFDGSMGSIGEMAQGTLGGLAQSEIPGVGVAAGIAAAAVGTITATWEKVDEATTEAKESAYEYALTVAASGDFASTSARIDDLTGSVEGLKKVQDLAVATGWEQKDVLTALATGDGLPALKKAFDEGALSTNIQMGRLSELEGVIKGTAEGFELGADASRLNESALYDLVTATGKATGKFTDLGKQIYAMPDGTEIVVDAKTKTATEKLDDVAEKAKNMPDAEVKYRADTREPDNYRPPTKYGTVVYQSQAGTRQRG